MFPTLISAFWQSTFLLQVSPSQEFVSPILEMRKVRISNRFEKHIVAAAAVAMGAAAAANAAVVYSGVLNFACAVDIDGCYINVETNTLSNGPGTGVPGWDVNPYRSSTGSGMNFFSPTGGGFVTSGSAQPRNLLAGTYIGSAEAFISGASDVRFGPVANGYDWQYGTNNLFGFRFVAASGATHYGWMRFLMGSQPATGNLVTRTVVDFGYESVAGASILAGAGTVPAPSALALLGVAGLAGSRRRRN